MPVVLPVTSATDELLARPMPRGHVRPDHGARLARWPLAALVLFTVALHVVANVVSPYGVHRDELLYLAMGRHLRLWQMDFPPAIAILAELTRAFVSARAVESVTVIRMTSALAAGALVLLAGLIAHALGGRRGAQLLAAGTVLASPLFLRAGSLFQPVVFDQLWWTLALYATVRLGRADRRPAEWSTNWRDWTWLGVALGLGLLTKFSILFLGVGLLAGVLLTPLRGTLRTPMPWLATVLAFAIGAPSVVGQLRLGWPVVGQMRELRGGQLMYVGALDYLGGQLLWGPAVLLATLGVWGVLRRSVPRESPLRAGRAAMWAAVTAWLLLLALRGKAYYIGPIYPLLWAAGAATLEQRAAERFALHPARRRQVALAGAAAIIGAYGLMALSLGLPIVPPAPMARYAAALGVGTSTNTGGRLELPQDYADMLGWPAQAAAMADVYQSLSEDERGLAVVAAGNYGEAGALDLYGPTLGLPPAISSAGSYWFFGPGDLPGDVTLVLANADAADDLRRLFADVRPVRRVVHADLRWVVPEERNVWIFRCTQPRRSLQELWPSLAGRN